MRNVVAVALAVRAPVWSRDSQAHNGPRRFDPAARAENGRLHQSEHASLEACDHARERLRTGFHSRIETPTPKGSSSAASAVAPTARTARNTNARRCPSPAAYSSPAETQDR